MKYRGALGLVRWKEQMVEQLRRALRIKHTAQVRRFLRLQEVKARVGLSRSWIYEAIRRGDFPAPVRLSARAVAWDSTAIAEWQERRLNGNHPTA